MAPSSGELFGHHLMPTSIQVDCLLPNGVIIQLTCYRDSPLEKIKSELWREAQNFPLFHLLKDASAYIFVSITQDAEKEEFYDESRRLCDLRLFQPILKLVEPEGNLDEKIANSEISQAMGIHTNDFDEISDAEVIECRRNIFHFIADCFHERNSEGCKSQALYKFPPEIEDNPDLPPSMLSKLDRGYVKIAIWFLSDTFDKQKHTIAVQFTATPEEIIREAIYFRIKSSDKYKTPEEKKRAVFEHSSAYVLKVAGSDQMFFKECAIAQYKYIRACIARHDIPQLMLLSRKKVFETMPDPKLHKPSYLRKTVGTPASTPKEDKLWDWDGPFRLYVISATYVNVKEADLICVRAGLYHGTDPLCKVKVSKEVAHAHPRWDDLLEFDISYTDLPRAAKLCLSLCSIRKRKNGGEEVTMLYWGNLNVFDYKHRLALTGTLYLYLRPAPKEMEELLYPIGASGTNPNDPNVRDSPTIRLGFEKTNRATLYPTMADFENYGELLKGLTSSNRRYNINHIRASEEMSEDELKLLQDIIKRDPLAEISEQEKDALWRLRKHCLKMPNILPRLLDAVNWGCRDHITQVYLLLKDWPPVGPHTALELLDCKYADPIVRNKAVDWLNQMSDEDMGQYMLQLVQTLKYEPYLDNPLSRLLLRRVLLNRKLGHFFFWHLKSELQNPSLYLKLGLILEAYCRGLGPYLKDLIRMVEALDKLTTLTDSIKKDRPQDSQKDRLKFLTDQMRQADYTETLQNFLSPLENNVILGQLEVSKCKVFDSAKKPLWLVWKNPDPLANIQHDYNTIIFKNGDDLRQDMLTLQVIRIMDHIWHTEGMDLRMTPYSCLATGTQVGVIEVVRDAKTVYKIQQESSRLAAMQVDSSQLYKWIRDHNKNRMDQAIETFTLSCAGYCVATFILGIGDRNPDNIMVKEDGQIFHIDFGHFLGHYKKKFGIVRERVPFVLTEDFLYVISRGKQDPKRGEEFAQFQELCGKAYLALRRHANLLITLFMMMLPSGITELQSINDVSYLRQTLAVEKNDKEALEYFQNVFNDAYKGAWTTKLDWFFHSVRHGVN